MKAYLLKYTIKVVSKGFKEINLRNQLYFKSKQILIDFINHKNALSLGDIYYISKTDKEYNRESKKITVPPNYNSVQINKYETILIK